jgi:hypothetical protein
LGVFDAEGGNPVVGIVSITAAACAAAVAAAGLRGGIFTG